MDASASHPVFVYGALRSGTTLFRLMLDSHPEIANPGEVDFIFEYLRRDGAGYAYEVEALRLDRIFQSYALDIPNVADGKEAAREFVAQFLQRTPKRLTLNIHRNLDRVAAIFPSSRFIHILRDPRDVARSCVEMGWAGNTYFGVEQWMDAEQSWDHLAHFFPAENVVCVRYEELISDPPRQLEKVCKFIGVRYSSKMLDYPSHSTYSAPDSAAIYQWRKNMRERDATLVEIKAKALLLARNYELSGFPLRSPNLFETAQLFISNKIYKWRFSCRRFGLFSVLMERLTRYFLPSYHKVLVQRFNEIDKQHLK